MILQITKICEIQLFCSHETETFCMYLIVFLSIIKKKPLSLAPNDTSIRILFPTLSDTMYLFVDLLIFNKRNHIFLLSKMLSKLTIDEYAFLLSFLFVSTMRQPKTFLDCNNGVKQSLISVLCRGNYRSCWKDV